MTPQRQTRSSLSEINVTPLVDVMLVLLIIFMVTAPLMQQGISVDLPETTASGIEASDEPFVLIIKKNKSVFVDDLRFPLKNLRSKLKAIFLKRKNKQIYIQADRRVEYGFVAEVMAEIKAAGISNIALVTIPKTR